MGYCLKILVLTGYFIKTSSLIRVKVLLCGQAKTDDSGLRLVACGRKATFAARNIKPFAHGCFWGSFTGFLRGYF